MSTEEKIKEEIVELVKEAELMSENFDDFPFIITKYQSWYTSACKIVKIFLPERMEEFSSYYDGKFVDLSIIYNIQFFMIGKLDPKSLGFMNLVLGLFRQQIAILNSIKKGIDNKLLNINLDLQCDYGETELSTAKNLMSINLRASGCIAGIVLEKHLKTILNVHIPNHGKKDKDLTLGVINDLLKEVVYDNTTWRQITYLSELRNLCDHDKKDCDGKTIEPKKDDIETLINGVYKITNLIH